MQNIYVVVADNDRPVTLPSWDKPHVDDGGPLIFEQYIRFADLENIKKTKRSTFPTLWQVPYCKAGIY